MTTNAITRLLTTCAGALLLGGLAIALLGGLATAQDPATSPATQPALAPPEQITAAILEATVTKLASDEFKGRDAASGGLEKAAEYLTGLMAAHKLEPAGDNAGYSQSFSLGRVTSKIENQVLSAAGEPVGPAAGWMLLAPCAGVWAGPVRYGGDGAEATLAAIPAESIRGSILLVQLSGPLFQPDAAESLRTIAQRAAPLGAVGVVGVAGSDVPGRMWGRFALRRMASRTGTESDIVRQGAEGESRIPAVWCERRALAPIFGTEVATSLSSLEPGTPLLRPGEAGAEVALMRLTLTASAIVQDTVNYRNVIGRITGTDPKLKNEVVVLSAHYDHIGVSTNAQMEDRIFNGADDDASGTAAIMAMGAAFAANPPKRTVLVVAFTAEEKGLLGSKHFVAHPVVPLKQIVAGVNVEMIGRPAAAGAGAMWITGYSRSSFGPIFALASAPAGVNAIDDPYAMMGFFQRSDNYSLAQHGIPAHTCSSYNPRGARYYHQTNDHAADCDFGNMATLVHGIYLGARTLAMGEATPVWTAGDPLAKQR